MAQTKCRGRYPAIVRDSRQGQQVCNFCNFFIEHLCQYVVPRARWRSLVLMHHLLRFPVLRLTAVTLQLPSASICDKRQCALNKHMHLHRKCLTVCGCIRGSICNSRQYSACNKHTHMKCRRLTGRQRRYPHWRSCPHWSACKKHIYFYAANAHTTCYLCIPCSTA